MPKKAKRKSLLGRKTKAAQLIASKRKLETGDKRRKCLQASQARACERLQNETPDERQACLEYGKALMAHKRWKYKNPDKHQTRLQNSQDREQKQWQNETLDERQAPLHQSRACACKQQQNETPDNHQVHLQPLQTSTLQNKTAEHQVQHWGESAHKHCQNKTLNKPQGWSQVLQEIFRKHLQGKATGECRASLHGLQASFIL